MDIRLDKGTRVNVVFVFNDGSTEELSNVFYNDDPTSVDYHNGGRPYFRFERLRTGFVLINNLTPKAEGRPRVINIVTNPDYSGVIEITCRRNPTDIIIYKKVLIGKGPRDKDAWTIHQMRDGRWIASNTLGFFDERDNVGCKSIIITPAKKVS